MCMLHFLYACFGRYLAREADKKDNSFLKKILCSSYVPQFFLRNIRGYVTRLAEEHKFGYVPRLAVFLGVTWPMSVRTYVHQDMFLD
jgi:hypothetical protein